MSRLYPTVRHARENPTGLALVAHGDALDHAALEVRARAAARALAARGVRAGDRVAVLAANSAAWVSLAHALPRLGAVLAPLHTRLALPEIRDQAARLRPKLVVVDAAAREAAAALEEDGLACVAIEALATPEAPQAEAAVPVEFDPDAPHTVLFTSGSSGRPKGVVLTFANHEAGAHASAPVLGVGADDRWLLCLPLSHVGGLGILVRAAVFGFAVVLHERFDPAGVWSSLRDDGVTIASLVPEMLARVLAAEPGMRAPRSFRVVLLGGGPTTAALLREARERGFRVATTYGLTEAASQVTTAPWDAPPREGCGPPLPGIDVRLGRADGGETEPGQEGEILVRGPTVMRGYLDDPGATHAAFEGGWLRTGDVGRWSAEGDLVVLARRSDLFVSGGENVSPAEIEAVLREHPAVAAAVVAGVPDELWGQVPAALVVPRPGPQVARAESPTLAAELATFAAGRLARFKVPKRIMLVDRLPETASGKPDRVAAARLLAEKP